MGRSVYGSRRFVALEGSGRLSGLHEAGSHACTCTRENAGGAVGLSVALGAVWMLARSLGLAGWLWVSVGLSGALEGAGWLWSGRGLLVAVGQGPD